MAVASPEHHGGSHVGMTRNPQRVAMRAWLAAVVLGCCLAVTPVVFSIGLFKGGGTMAMAGVSVAALSLVMTLIYRKRARLLDRVVAGEDLLAHWTYDAETWRQYVEREIHRSTSTSRIPWAILALVFAIPAIGVIVLSGPHAIAILGVVSFYTFMLLMARTIAICSVVERRSELPMHTSRHGGVLIGGKFHTWNGWAYELDSAVVHRNEPDVLEIGYSYTPRRSSSKVLVRIPIPAGERRQAEEICECLLKQKGMYGHWQSTTAIESMPDAERLGE